jgi:hypothetical protein
MDMIHQIVDREVAFVLRNTAGPTAPNTRASASRLEVMNSPVGSAQPPAQLTANSSQEPDGDAWEFGRHYREVRRGKGVAREVCICDDRCRARPCVEQRKLSEHRAGSKRLEVCD